jgi:hypothetical protein
MGEGLPDDGSKTLVKKTAPAGAGAEVAYSMNGLGMGKIVRPKMALLTMAPTM